MLYPIIRRIRKPRQVRALRGCGEIENAKSLSSASPDEPVFIPTIRVDSPAKKQKTKDARHRVSDSSAASDHI